MVQKVSAGARLLAVLKDRKRPPDPLPRWQRWLTSTFAQALVGVMIAGGFTIWQVGEQIDAGREQQQDQFEQSRKQQAGADQLLRDLAVKDARRPIYDEFLAA